MLLGPGGYGLGEFDLHGPEHGLPVWVGRVQDQVCLQDRGRPGGGLHQVQEGFGRARDAGCIRLEFL